MYDMQAWHWRYWRRDLSKNEKGMMTNASERTAVDSNSERHLWV